MKVVNPVLVLPVAVVDVLLVVPETDPHVRDLVLPNLPLSLLNPQHPPTAQLQVHLEKHLLNVQLPLHTNPILPDPKKILQTPLPKTQTVT
jgi:hypothetical protein